ncbi:MAG: hypothetical protein ACYSUI_03305 [Planctomycetota bacterium]
MRLGGRGPTLANCTFTDNSHDDGGGINDAWASSLTVTNCICTGNLAGDTGAERGGREARPLRNIAHAVTSKFRITARMASLRRARCSPPSRKNNTTFSACTAPF